jgi:hypothetical protein
VVKLLFVFEQLVPSLSLVHVLACMLVGDEKGEVVEAWKERGLEGA